jgi:hypothetical protein
MFCGANIVAAMLGRAAAAIAIGVTLVACGSSVASSRSTPSRPSSPRSDVEVLSCGPGVTVSYQVVNRSSVRLTYRFDVLLEDVNGAVVDRKVENVHPLAPSDIARSDEAYDLHVEDFPGSTVLTRRRVARCIVQDEVRTPA